MQISCRFPCVLLGTCLATAALSAPAPVVHWSFDSPVELEAGTDDSLHGDTAEGNTRYVDGVAGSAMVFDGYTSVLTRAATHAPQIDDELTIDVWLAVGAYPWNDVPIVSHTDDHSLGYALQLGPHGELRFNAATNWRPTSVATDDFVVPLRKWTHISGRFDGKRRSLSIFVNGVEVANKILPERGIEFGRVPTQKIQPASGEDLIIGAVREPQRPASFHRLKGTRPSWYSFDGIMDELRIYDVALTDDELLHIATAVSPPAPDLPDRRLPSGPPGPARFAAYMTTLSFYPEWDALWRVGEHADIVVRFDNSPARVVFWRGTQYSPAWVTENNLWMADQSVEGYDDDYTWEHMNDKQNRYSHVRIVEQHDARVVVHWRYAPVNVNDELMNVQERLNNGAWVDEYYFFYPDATGVRKVTWQHDTLGEPIQFQESIPLAHPGQAQGEVVQRQYATVGNLSGDTQVLAYVENPGETDKRFPPDLTIQMHNLRAAQKPFIVFEPGNRMMYLRDLDERSLQRPGSSSHWPVGQVLSDGRTAQALDRTTSFLGFPISEPVRHEGADGRDYINMLYGMTDRPFEALLPLARSWSQPPPLTVERGDYQSSGYDRSERVYRLLRPSGGGAADLSIAASAESPVHNLTLLVENWGESPPGLLLDGQQLEYGAAFRYGLRYRLEQTDLIIWTTISASRPISLRLTQTDASP